MFKIGDTVQLSSGGPVMTVEAIDNNDVSCVWYNQATDDYKYNNFNSALLVEA